jgi:hypothetical protein
MEQPPKYRTYKGFFKALQTIKLDQDLTNPFAANEEVVQLCTSKQVHASHQYKIVTNPHFRREITLDQIYEPEIGPFPDLDPAGTELETMAEYEISLSEKKGSKFLNSLDMNVLIKTLGLKIGTTSRHEYTLQYEKKERSAQRQRKKHTVPPQKVALQANISFRFDIGFKRYQTLNHGENWIPAGEYRFPLEIQYTHCVFVDQNYSYEYCYQKLEDEVTNFIQPRVQQWLSKKLKHAKLISPSC